MKRRLISVLLIVCMVFGSIPTSAFGEDQNLNQIFIDVSPDNWFYDSVMESFNSHIFSGTTKDTFSPYDPMTRAMYVTIMGRIAQVDENVLNDNLFFNDLKSGAYYVPYVLWAVEKGITQGIGNNQFSPDSKVTREQMATLTVRFFDAYEIPYLDNTITTVPKDFNEVSPWAQEAVLKLWSSGLFKGDEQGNFNPQNNATRAEAATFSVRINKKVVQYHNSLEPSETENSTQNINSATQNTNSSTATYYRISFESNGGSLMNSFSRREGGDLTQLPVPYKEGYIFGGWYYDAALTKLVASKDLLRHSLTLYAKWGDAVPLAETETLRFASAIDASKDFTIKVLGLQSMSADLVESLISVKNFNSQEDQAWIKVEKSGSDFILSGINYSGVNGAKQNGFEEGASYRLTLNDERLMFEGFSQETRDFNLTITKEDVFNLKLNEKMDFIKFEAISNIQENGSDVNTIYSTPLSITENGTGAGVLVEGTFTYTQSALAVGDTVTIYEGIHPNERLVDDSRDGAKGNIAYVEITSAVGTTYGYKTADIEGVLFTPDILPVSVDADTDGNPYNNSITIDASVLDFSDDLYAVIGLDSQTTIDVGDYISFYEGDLTATPGGGNAPDHSGYGWITSVTYDDEIYVITYDLVTLETMLAAMDMYNTDPIDGDDMLQGIDVATFEAQIEQQAMESGFANSAGLYLAAMAMETHAFTEITEDFELRNYEILGQNGDPLSPEEVQLMAGSDMSVKVEVETPEAIISTNLEHFDGISGLSLTLKIKAKITIGPKKPADGDAQVVITLTGEFVEEVHVGININGGARWEWWAIFPYIAEYEVTTNVDLYNYTGLKFHASIVTKAYKDKKWTDDAELKNVVDELKKLVDEVKKGLGSDEEKDDPANDLIKKYQAMMETESDWVNLVEKEMFEIKKNIPPIMIIQVSLSLKFVIQANMNISLGAEFWYKTAKRYTYHVEIFAGNITSDVLDLVEEQYAFTFYVMGMLGLRAGLQLEAKIALIDEKIASVGFAAESGAYIKMYGYFYYQLTYSASQGKASQYAGALYFELGIYLEITFEAQAFAGTFSYNPTLYENEWPLWYAGMRENIQSFAYKESEAPALSMKKAIQTAFVPDSVFEMLYLDLKTGDSDTKIYDDSEDYFTIEMTNDKFAYDRETNRLSIVPDQNDVKLAGQMVISWINQPLAWTSKPISIRIDVTWDNLNDGYAIVFHSNGGSSIPMIIKRYGGALVLPADPVKKGYVFEGWYLDEGFTQVYLMPETMPNSDVEVYAKWSPATDTPYKVEHFGEVLGSSDYELLDRQHLTGTTNSTVSADTIPYMGYSVPESKTITLAPDGSSSLRYYYDRALYSVTFNPGEAQGDNLVNHLKFGAKMIPPALSSKGYTFLGWSPAITDHATMPAQELTYTALWSPADDTPYRVEYYVEQTNGRYTLQRLDSTQSGVTGSIVGIQTYFDEQYVVTNGISYRDTTVNGVVTNTPMITKDGKLIIKVLYQREHHDAIFDPDNGIESTIISVAYQGIIRPPYENPTKEGYVFNGWEGHTLDTIMDTKDITFTARWTPAEGIAYTVKHICEDLNGSYPESGDGVEIEMRYGTTEAMTEAQSKDYVGFSTNGVVQVAILPDGSSVVEITYSRNRYTINWMADGNLFKTEDIFYGALITKPMVNPTKQGYEFATWSGLGDGATMGIVEQTFTATWNPANDTQYRVNHMGEDLSGNPMLLELENKQGTTGTQTAASPKTYEGFTANPFYTQTTIQPDGSSVVIMNYTRNLYSITWVANSHIFEMTHSVVYGGAINLPMGIPINKVGYTFDAWLNVPVTMPSRDTSYEASWTANSYTVTFQVNGGDNLDVNTKGVTYDSAYGTLPTPTYTGYQFVNWTDTNGSTITSSTLVRTPLDHVLTAIWAADTDVAYIVNHYLETVEGGSYTHNEGTTLYGETDTPTTAVANSYLGFSAQPFTQVNITGDGLAIVDIYYNRNRHTVTWIIDGAATPVTYPYGANIILPYATRTGYTFANWDTTVPSSMPDYDLTYTARWTANVYTVTFDGNSGSTPSPISVTYDSTYGGLPTPTKVGYTFEGWFTDRYEGVQVVAGTVVAITANQTLYARWRAKTYTVSFDLNTGVGTLPDPITVTYEDTYAALPQNNASKTGYTFAGWYTALSGGHAIIGTSLVTTSSDHTLHARWQANTYSVVFDANGGSGVMDNQIYTYDQAQILMGNSFTKTGFSFNGWNTQSDGGGTAFASTENVTNLATTGTFTLYAQWTVNTYTISFNSMSGSIVASIEQNYGTAVTAPESPTREGYTFGTWQYNGQNYTFTTMPAENITLTGTWTIDTYNIIYDLDGGINDVDNPSSYNIESGHITLRDASAKAGYTFDGWYTEASRIHKVADVAINAGSMGTKSFYAKWVPNAYTVRFDKNIGDGTTTTQNFTYDETAKALLENTFTRAGYTFVGWNANADGTGTNYSDMQVVQNLAKAGTVTLYAKWQSITYAITYHLNGGDQAGGNPLNYTVMSSDILFIDPTRVGGYGFMGWYDNPSYTGDKVTSITKGSIGDMTLYAKWGYAGTFTVTNNGNNLFTITRNGNGVLGDAQNVGQQTVYFRTVNGSAIGGTHFVHQGGTIAAVTFADGEDIKIVTITEYGVNAAYNGNVATRYSNIDRTYQLELVRIVGGGLLGSTIKATRTMAKDNNYVVPSNVYNYKSFASHSVNTNISESIGGSYAATQYTGLSGNPITNRGDTAYVRDYLLNTASLMSVKLDITGEDDGWRMHRFVFFNNHTLGTSTGKASGGTLDTLPTGTKAAFVYGISTDTNNRTTYTVQLPAANGTISSTPSIAQGVSVFSSRYGTGQTSTTSVYYGFNETVGISVGAHNPASAISSWMYKGGSLFSAPHDTKEPSRIGFAPMAAGEYKAGETVTIAVVFDEIVADRNGATISGTNLNTMTYVGGIGSNVLYFTGTVKHNSTELSILNGITLSGTVLDMAN